jgi:hypothetical protein
MALLYGRAGRLTIKNGGFRPGQSRHVYLPPLPTGDQGDRWVWKNVFTGAETDTSAGGKNISEATPLDTFPLYKRHQKTPTPPPPPPPPPAPPPGPPVSPAGGGKCSVLPGTDLNGGDLTHVRAADFSACCALCVKHPECVYWTFAEAGGVPTCWLKHMYGTKLVNPGHVSGQVQKSTASVLGGGV